MHATAQVSPIAQFAPVQWKALATLCAKVSGAVAWPLELEAGATDDGQSWAALCIHDAPAGNVCDPGPLVTIIPTQDSHDLYAVLDAWGGDVLDGLTFEQALALAEYTAQAELSNRVETLDGRVRNYAHMVDALEIATDLLDRL
nr:hypothetical protein [Variovorax boronicumulans]